jgi:hypothetical protein
MKDIIEVMQTYIMKTHPDAKYCWKNHQSENNQSCG